MAMLRLSENVLVTTLTPTALECGHRPFQAIGDARYVAQETARQSNSSRGITAEGT